MVKYAPPLLSAVRSFKATPMQSSGSPLYLFASVLRCGANSSIDGFNPRLFTNSMPLEFIASAPDVFRPMYAIDVLPFLSSLTTALLSFCASRIPPSLVATMPSALLPSTCQTSFHCCPAAITPGISVTSLGPGSAAAGAGTRRGKPAPLGGGGTLHVFNTSASFASLGACTPGPVFNGAAEGFCPSATIAPSIAHATAQTPNDFMTPEYQNNLEALRKLLNPQSWRRINAEGAA